MTPAEGGIADRCLEEVGQPEVVSYEAIDDEIGVVGHPMVCEDRGLLGGIVAGQSRVDGLSPDPPRPELLLQDLQVGFVILHVHPKHIGVTEAHDAKRVMSGVWWKS